MSRTARIAGRMPRALAGTLPVFFALAVALTTRAAPAALPPVPAPPENPITEPKRVLGKILFWDEQLSSSNVVSCGTCHVPGRAGADDRLAQNPGPDNVFGTPDDRNGSPGVIASNAVADYLRDAVFGLRPQVTPRAANPAINAAYAPQLFWDGRASGRFTDPQTGEVAIAAGGALESQLVGPPVSSVEMAHQGIDWDAVVARLRDAQPIALATNHPADVASALSDRPNYPELFRRAFGDPAITARRIAFAIATYERTLISDQSPWDRFVAGQPGALTPGQQQGLQALQASNCTQCHAINGGQFTDHSFRNIGLRPPAEDLGRQVVTTNPADRGRFKVPSLRNVGLKRTFMHNGQFTTIPQVLGFYARAPGAPQQFPDNRDPIMPTVNVPPQAAQVIGDFLVNGLTDPRVAAQTFPFDSPTLFVNRPADRNADLGGGVGGTGGVVPRMIAQAPALIGSSEFRIGIDGALGGASARLAVSSTPPQNGRVNPDELLGPVTAQGVGAGLGLGTLHWPIPAGSKADRQVVFAQWIVDDPAAPGGRALSNAVRITFFCGSGGCPPACAADIDANGLLSLSDVFTFLGRWFAGDARCDTNRDNAVTVEDVFVFLSGWFAGCG